MKIILNEDVYNLGEEGDICEVKPGYGRNYLIPQNLAVAYNKGNAAKFERRRDVIEKRKEEKRKAALGDRERIESLELVIPMPAGDSGKLFGSVNNATVADALAKEGVHIERKKVDLPENTIKMIGKYKARIRLYESNIAELSFTVVDEKTGASEPKGAAKAETKAPAEAPAADAAGEAVEEPAVETPDGETVEEPAKKPAVSEEAVEEDDAGEEE